MSRIVKIIENPEVPGLECLLPPPPPPPPLVSATNVDIKNSTVNKTTGILEKGTDKATVVEKSEIPKVGLADGAQSESGGRTTSSNENLPTPFPMTGVATFFENMQNPYVTQPVMEQLPVMEQPWWIPTESDNIDVASQSASWNDRNALWTDLSQKNIPPGSKAKGKFFKRKSECVDPVQDAERVANAQRELSALMKPLTCDLCNAIMNSNLQAKLHYEGKPHQKKVSVFLNQSVKKLKADDGQVSSTTSNIDWSTYCEVCKTWFTSQTDANQHYAGKKHIRATTGATKQQTKKPQVVQAPVDPTGRFGIGASFSMDVVSGTNHGAAFDLPLMPLISPSVVPTVNNYETPNWPFPTFRCELCGVTANRLEQLETHKRGARHMRMMKMSNLVNPVVDEIKDVAKQSMASSIDYSIYRTPSGQYYCAPCNRSFRSEDSFAQHIESKKHKTQINPKQPTPSFVAGKKHNKSK